MGDRNGLYDPTEFNDRRLPGLKGTMSEAELHILKGRMSPGRLNKADRGRTADTSALRLRVQCGEDELRVRSG